MSFVAVGKRVDDRLVFELLGWLLTVGNKQIKVVLPPRLERSARDKENSMFSVFPILKWVQ